MNKKNTAELKGLLAMTVPAVQAETTAAPVWQLDAIDAVVNFVTSETLEKTAGEQLRRVFGSMIGNKINLPYAEAEARRVFVVQCLRKETPSLTDDTARVAFSRLFKVAYDILASKALPKSDNVKAVEIDAKRQGIEAKAAPLAKIHSEEELGDMAVEARKKQVLLDRKATSEVKKAVAEEVKVADRALTLAKATAAAEETNLCKAGREAAKNWNGQQWKIAMEAVAAAE